MRSLSLLRRFVRRVSYVQGQSVGPRTREYFYYIDHQGQLFLDDTRVKNFITCFKDKKFLDFFFKRVKLNTTGRYDAEFQYISPCGRETNYIRCDDLPIVFSQLLDSENHIIEDIAGCGGRTHTTSSETTHHTNTERESISSSCQTPTATTTRSAAEPSSADTVFTRGLSSHPVSDSAPRVADTTKYPHHTEMSLAYGGTLSLTVPFQPSSLCMLPASGRVYHMGPSGVGGVGLIKSSLAIELSRFFVYEEGAGESAHPVAFQWQGKTWELDTTLLSRLADFTNIRENDSYM